MKRIAKYAAAIGLAAVLGCMSAGITVHADREIGFDDALEMVLSQMPVLEDLDAEIDDHEYIGRHLQDEARLAHERQTERMRIHRDRVASAPQEQLRRMVVGIMFADIEISRQSAQLEISRENLRRAEALHSFGRVSTAAVTAARSRVVFDTIALENLRLSKASSQALLDNMLGLPSENVVVQPDMYLPDLPQDVEAYIDEAARGVGHVRLLYFDLLEMRRMVYFAQWMADDAAQEVRTAYQRAYSAWQSALHNMQAQLQASYGNLRQIEVRLDAAHESLLQAEESLAATTASFEMGRLGTFEMLQASNAVADAQLAIERLIIEQWLVGLEFFYPGV